MVQCSTLTIIEQAVTCSSLQVDTWQPSKTQVGSGEAVPFVIRTQEPNKHFLAYINPVLGQPGLVMMEGTTDSTGCFSGELPAPTTDGSLVVYFCLDTLGVCAKQLNAKTITWGSKPLDIQTLAIYAIGGLAAAYIIGSLLRSE